MSKHPRTVSDELRDPAPEREGPPGPFVAGGGPLIALPQGGALGRTPARRADPMTTGRGQLRSRPPIFAQILCEQGKLTQQHLDEALRRQVTEQRYLGEILCEVAPLK